MPKEMMMVWYGDTPCGHEAIHDNKYDTWFCPTCWAFQALMANLEQLNPYDDCFGLDDILKMIKKTKKELKPEELTCLKK